VHLRFLGLLCCLCSIMLAAVAMAARPHPHGVAPHRHHGSGHARGERGLHGGNCVAYARAVTGIRIDGDAGSWWHHAEGRYQRGQNPVPGAVLVFKPHGRMWHGHVAVVSRILGSREILVDQANWIRGRVSTAMAVIDVSPANDWTMVKVRSQRGGVRANPTFGFVYPDPVVHQGDEIVTAAGSDARLAAPRPPATKVSLETDARPQVPDRRFLRVHAARHERGETRRKQLETRLAHAREVAEAGHDKTRARHQKLEARRAHAREIAEARREKAQPRHEKVAARHAHAREIADARRDRHHHQKHDAGERAARAPMTPAIEDRSAPIRVSERAQ
jgi:hypothetical protein